MIKSVWIEIRPVLRCCHVNVELNENLTSKVQIKVKKSSMVLKIENQCSEVHFPDFEVEPLTMSNFKTTNQNLNFRIQVECKLGGEYPIPPKTKPPTFNEGKSSLRCHCHNPLTCEVIFDRVLPLPSNEFNASDMFCHLHGGEVPSMPKPRSNDCLYSDDFIVVSNEIVTGCAKREKFFKCKRCLTTVGFLDNDSVQFWVSSINLPVNLSLYEHFRDLVWKAAADPFSMLPKILLECEECKTYLYMTILDKNLIVSKCENNLQLKNQQVVKLKYEFHSCYNAEIKLLKKDPFHSLHHIQIHKTMMDFIVQYLINNSKTIPSVFSVADDECMAYIILKE